MTDFTTIWLLIFYLGIVPFVSVMAAFLIGNLIFRTIRTRRRKIIRNNQLKTEAYSYNDVLNSIAGVPSPNLESFFGYDGTIPDNTVIEKYRACGLNEIFGEDGVIYYTDDKALLCRRNELFAELSQNGELLEMLKVFSESTEKMMDYDTNANCSKADIMKQLSLAKNFVLKCTDLAVSPVLSDTFSAILQEMYKCICAIVRSNEFASLQNLLLRISDTSSVTAYAVPPSPAGEGCRCGGIVQRQKPLLRGCLKYIFKSV